MPVAIVPTVTGFYRYSDIWWEWYKVLPNPEDGSPLKAILAYDSLVDPGHPLRLPGAKGIELSVGTLQNGEARLLFSSAQVEYIRYWLHEMGYTKELLPLPYADCLLTASSLQNHSPVVYSDAGSLRNAIKLIDKNNKRLKGTDTNLSARRNMFERVRALWAERRGTWCALDFEAWDLDHTVLTECGWSLVRHDADGTPTQETGHLVVKEHQHYTNHYVPEHRAHYTFGASAVVSRREFKARINALLARLQAPGPLFLVFHDNAQDVKYLRSPAVDAPLPNLSHILPESCAAAAGSAEPLLFVVDTALLFAALEGDSGGQMRALERVCRHLQIRTEYLHNAGNDARYTHLALAAMAAGDPIDMQREKRWPNRTPAGAGPRVRFRPTDEDSDASEDEDFDLAAFDGPYDPRTGVLREGWVPEEKRKIGIEIGKDGVGKVSGDGKGANGDGTKVNGRGGGWDGVERECEVSLSRQGLVRSL